MIWCPRPVEHRWCGVKRGDSYFKIGPADPPDLNRVRAIAQLALFRRLRERADEARRFIEWIK